MKIIDSHLHLYKSAEAGRLAQNGVSNSGYWGTIEEARPILDRGRIHRAIGLAVIPIWAMRKAAMQKWSEETEPSRIGEMAKDLERKLQERLSGYNEWLCRTAREDGRIEPAIAADPTIEGNFMVWEIVDKVKRFQVKILKIHPAVSKLSPSYMGFRHIFEAAEKKGLTVISHGGLSADDPEGEHCTPAAFRNVLDRFPQLKLVVAHLTFPHVEDLAALMQEYPNLYTDLSFVMSLSPLTDEDFVSFIRRVGADRVLFGSDFPWSDPEKDAQRLLQMGLSEDELSQIAYQNACRVFGLSKD